MTSRRSPKSAEFAKRSNSAENEGSILTRRPIHRISTSSWLAIAMMRLAIAGNGGKSRSAHGA